MLTDSQRRFFWDNGYLALEGFLTADELEAIRRAVEELVAKAANLTAPTKRYDVGPARPGGEPVVRRIFNPAEADPRLEAIALNDRVLDVVEALIGPNIEFHHGKVNLKWPRGGAEVAWHQDLAFFPHTNTDLVACMFYLDDATVENGCLLVLPGSHRYGVLDHFADGVFVGAVTDALEILPMDRVQPVEVPAGSMTVHHCLLLHASEENRSDKPRRVLIYQYRAADAMQLVPDRSGARHYGRLLRGEQAGVVRCEPITYRLPNHFAADRQRSLYELQEEFKRKQGIASLVERNS